MIRILSVLRIVSLAVFFGGGAAIALIVAPVAFKTLAPDRQAAGAVVGAALHAFEYVAFGALVAALGASLALRKLKQPSILCDASLALLLGATIYLAASVAPSLREARPQGTGAGTEFDRLHKLYEKVFGVELLVALTALVAASAPRKTT